MEFVNKGRLLQALIGVALFLHTADIPKSSANTSQDQQTSPLSS